jgi:hypothetical protein
MEDDIAAQIKLISSHFPASVSRSADATSYVLYIYTPARGYQNTVTLTERSREKVVIAAIYERKGPVRLVTLLVDEGADGRLDYTIAAPTLEVAMAAVRAHRGTVTPSADVFQPLYDRLLRDVRETALEHYRGAKTALRTVANRE